MNNFILFRENIRVSFQSIRSNLLRTILTILIITLGITSLVGILTAVDSIRGSVSNSFSMMGANTFTIESRGMFVQIGRQRHRTRNYSYISYREAQRFKDQFYFPSKVSVSFTASSQATVKYGSEKTNPVIQVIGGDENYISTGGYEINKGRNFSIQEIQSSSNTALIGSELSRTLFGEKIDALEKVITVGNSKYRVIGVLKEKGSAIGGRGDKFCILPVTNVRQYFSQPRMSYRISVLPEEAELIDEGLGEAEGLFRIIRRLNVKDESDFNINKSDNLAKMLLSSMKSVTIAATIIGFITLLGAAIGLMNIMLVAVSERTREIGTRKAIGAKAGIIKQQFLFEAIIIGQIGGALGIFFGILIGNLIPLITGGIFIIPWIWIISGVILCFIVSIASGYLPAVKASRLDPIIALRYE